MADDLAAGQVILPPFFFLGGLVAGVIVNIFLQLWIWSSPWRFLVGGILLMLGVWLLVDAYIAFKRHDMPTEPWKPTSQLVQDGPYRFTRNPIYLSFAILYVGWHLFSTPFRLWFY